MLDKVKSIKKISNKSKRYDIGVEINNNFYANKILVHNCQNLASEYETWKQSNVDFYITEKLDGCLDGDSIVETENGNMTIRDMCETGFNGKVKSYNVETKCVEYRKVTHVFINTPTTHQWFNITLENGTEIKLTGNHRVWLPELLCWRRVDALRGDEVFLLKN